MSFPGLKTLRRKVAKGFQFFTLATRSPTESPFEERDLEGLAGELLEILDELRLGFVVGADVGEGLLPADVEKVGL